MAKSTRDPHAAPTAPHARAGFKFLVVEADKHARKVLSDALKARGHRCIEAADGVQAVAAAGRERPDFIFVDHDIPRLDCERVCRHLRDDSSGRRVPIAVTTAGADDEELLRFMAAGADYCVAKPFSASDLAARMEAVCARLAHGDDIDPNTLLCGTAGLAREFNARVRADQRFACLYLDLDHLRLFNEASGFDAGDRLIRFTAAVVRAAVFERGAHTDAVMSGGGDAFAVFTGAAHAQPVAARVLELFERGRGHFYTAEERERGYVMTQTRRGEILEVPLVPVSIGVVTKQMGSLGEFWKNALELRSFIKSRGGGQYVLDRRSPLCSREAMPTVVAGLADGKEAVRLKYKMEELGWRLFTAHDGATALKLAHRLRPVAVLFDEELPLIRGVDAVRLMRLNPPTAGLPAIIAGTADPGGGLAWVAKPVDPMALDRALREAVPDMQGAAVASDCEEP